MRPDFPIFSTALLDRSKRRAREIVAGGRMLLEFGRPPEVGNGLVLMYHRVLPEETRLCYPIQPGMYVTAKTFEQHLVWLRQQYEVISLASILDRRGEGVAGARGACAITFDDGWRDTYSVAFPLLRKHRLPAAVFLTSGFIGTDKWFWPERVAFLTAALGGRGAEDLVASVDQRIEQLKGVPAAEREGIIHTMEAECRERGMEPPSEPQTLSWEQAGEMADEGIEFGSHTCNHVILTEVEPAQAENEIVESKRTIEENLGRRVDLFSYPNGNHNSTVRELVRKAGYRLAVTTTPGAVERDSDPWSLPRIGLHEDMSRTRSQLWLRIRRVTAAASSWPYG